MRRTLALLGTAALAVVALAAPANASQAGDIVFANTGLNGTGVQPDTTSPEADQAWFDLISGTEVDQSLVDHSVIGCVGTNTTPTRFVDYSNLDEVSPSAEFKTSDPNFSGPRNLIWDAPTGVLNSDSFDMRLIENLDSANPELIDRSVHNETGLSGVCVAELNAVS